jgi:16S rRNA processing protein RimM
VLCKFKNVDSRDAAEALKGKSIFIGNAANQNEKTDEWYIDNLLGFKVQDANGNDLGIVENLDISGPQHKLIVSGHIIPFVKELVPVVDLESNKIIVNLPEGLLQL